MEYQPAYAMQVYEPNDSKSFKPQLYILLISTIVPLSIPDNLHISFNSSTHLKNCKKYGLHQGQQMMYV